MRDPWKDSDQADTFSLVGNVCFFSGMILMFKFYATYIPYAVMGIGALFLIYSWMKSPNEPRW